ncbi:DUF3040 domain-containing protein [Streptomyces sp. NPDC057411]|uniref:DUF3040 domain-containing protein n=1 Tax=unclassified Streptomyces TaxID=2593676 RepID=UPI00363B1234
MDEARLSPRERRILAEIERDLGQDRALARGLRTGRWVRRVEGPATAVLGIVAIILFVLAVATEAPALIWAFAAVWVVTLVCLLRLLMGWSRRHLTGRERPRPDEPEV